MNSYFLGIDVGTQGVRLVLLDQLGNSVGEAEKVFTLTEGSREEQSPEYWWEACYSCFQELLISVRKKIATEDIVAISVTSTSGTVIPLDIENRPLHPAIMYSDGRSAMQGNLCREVAERFHPQGYTGFNASSGLSKMVWFNENFAETSKQIHSWIHASDFIVGKLSGNFAVTDFTNALKSGFDLTNNCWPDYLFDHLGLKKSWMQQVVPSGSVVGTLSSDLARDLQLKQIKVVAGMTDGCASQIASGAVRPGDWNTTIGTTMVIKGVTSKELKDPLGRFYSHRHPEGFWMPGGASNTGADWIATDFSKDLDRLNAEAVDLIPTGLIAYPLRQHGERFPFSCSEATGFWPVGISQAELFTASMEGVAYLERYAYELVENLTGEKVKAIFTAGGGSKSDIWLRIRSSVLNRPVFKCGQVSGAAGAAIVAASQTFYNSLTQAATAMTHIEKEIVPDENLVEAYEDGYHHFVQKLKQRGYITN